MKRTIIYRIETPEYIEILKTRQTKANKPRTDKNDQEQIQKFNKRKFKGPAELVRIITGDTPNSRKILAQKEPEYGRRFQ